MEHNIENGKEKKNKKGGILKNMKEHAMEFCRSTSLHGLQYIGEAHRPLFERLFWVLAFLVSTGAVIFYINKVWNKWNTTPVFVSFAETPTPIWEIPFPAVTICPQTKVKRDVYNFTEMFYKTNMTDEEIKDFEIAQLLCKDAAYLAWMRHLDQYDNGTTVEEILKFQDQVSPTLDESMFECEWSGKFYFRCNALFTTVVTDEGLCFSFNMLRAEEMFNNITSQRSWKQLEHSETSQWTFEKGYDIVDPNPYPQHSNMPGASGGLKLVISQYQEDVDPLCSLSIDGFKVVLHSPVDYPSVWDQFIRIPMGREVVVGIKPRIMTTSEALRPYQPERRQCFYSDERRLKYFSYYTYQNCAIECFANFTHRYCNCTQFHLPHDDNMSACGMLDQHCFYQAAADYVSDNSDLKKCNCLHGCTEIKYDVETSEAIFNAIDTYNAHDRARGHYANLSDIWKYSTVSFFYKDSEFVNSQRSELYGIADFLASCGGLLGFYLGFSLLSVVEIVYFFTIRIVSNFKALRK